MIYFDTAATSLQKPPEVAQGVAWAIERFGNPGRSAAEPAMVCARQLLAAREAVAGLVGLEDPARVAFTSGCTESMGLLCRTLGPGDHAIATELEHNSVLRPLYLSGCELDVLPCDARGGLLSEELSKLFRENTRFVFVSHGSNLTGDLTRLGSVYAECRRRGVPLVLDVAQTIGCSRVSMDMGDILCFSGHKGLFGPMGTGGLVVRPGLELPVLKTGGTGWDSAAKLQCADMPDLAEAGTPNAHGIKGMLEGIQFVQRTGLDQIIVHGQALTQAFYEGIAGLSRVQVYGDFGRWPRLPVVSFAVEGLGSAEVALTLWERFGIAVRPGSHCAPLLHGRLGTDKAGLVRCSFGWYNTLAEIRQGVEAVKEIVEGDAGGA